MNNHIDIQISIPSQTRYLGLIGSIGEQMARELNSYPGDKETLGHQLNLVLTEALVNAITHADCADPEKEIQVRITVIADRLVIQVYDNGQGFDLNLFPCDDCPDPLDERGRGIFIIRSLMDEVEYRPANGGHVLEMVKILR